MGIRWQIIVLVLLCVAAAMDLRGQEAEPPAPAILQQEPAPGGKAASDTPRISVRFAAGNVPAKEQVLLELDRVDVSALAVMVEDALQYDPTSPLAPGSHEVRITGTLPDGSPMPEVAWSFVVPEAKASTVWDFGLEPSATWEFGIRQEGEDPDRNRFNGNVAFNGQGTGRVQTTLNSNVQGQDSAGPSGENVDLANLTASFALPTGSTVSLWDVQANFDALAVSNLARRGITLQQKLPFLSSGVDVFFVRSDSVFGVEHGLGVSDNSQRIDGVSYFFSPLKNPESLTLRVLYARGENAAEEGFNFGGFTRGSKGNAYGFGLSSALFSGQLRTELFGSWSDFDFNASDDTDGSTDEAFLARVGYSPTPGTLRNRPSSFSLQLEAQNIGTFFKSIANPFLVTDRRGFNLNANWSWGILGFTGGASKFRDNVNDIEILPSVDNESFSGGFSVTPQGTDGPPKLPSFTFNATRGEQESANEPAAFLAVHSIVTSYGSVIAWTRSIVNLNLNLSYALNDDLNNRVPDTDSKNATLGAAITPAPSWNFGPSVSFTRSADRDSDIDSDLWTYSLTTGFPILPDRLILDGQVSYSSTETSDFLNRSSNFSGTAQLSLLLGQILKTPGRQSFSLRMSYNRTIVDAPFIVRQKGFEIFGTLDLSWPF